MLVEFGARAMKHRSRQARAPADKVEGLIRPHPEERSKSASRRRGRPTLRDVARSQVYAGYACCGASSAQGRERRSSSLRKDYYDSLEIDNPDLRERDLFGRLPNLIALALSGAGWARQLNGIDPNSVTSREALGQIPVLHAEDWPALRGEYPPFGGFVVPQRRRTRRLLMSPGPVFHPDVDGTDVGGAARALFAAGMRAGDVGLNCFSYHLSPFGFLMDSGAHALGCTVIAAGSDDAVTVADVMQKLAPSAFVGPADFLKRLLDVSDSPSEMSIKHALIANSPLTPALRRGFASAGIDVQECLTHPDIGIIAYESDARDGMIVNEGLIVEIVRPGSGEPVADGEVGEIVVTAFNPDYPMIRLATGQLSAVMRGRSPCGRTNMRIKGVLGPAPA
ncbi:MAG: AMP-binding protein [Rhizobiales bacterium]|nr:AMP-binding protein [Hyphomicrobiales bacterium]